LDFKLTTLWPSGNDGYGNENKKPGRQAFGVHYPSVISSSSTFHSSREVIKLATDSDDVGALKIIKRLVNRRSYGNVFGGVPAGMGQQSCRDWVWCLFVQFMEAKAAGKTLVVPIFGQSGRSVLNSAKRNRGTIRASSVRRSAPPNEDPGERFLQIDRDGKSSYKVIVRDTALAELGYFHLGVIQHGQTAGREDRDRFEKGARCLANILNGTPEQTDKIYLDEDVSWAR
jgi:hypothetical protein